MLIFVKDSRNRALYPTTKVDWAEKLVKRGQAKWIRKKVIILKLNYQVKEPPRDRTSYFVLGLDTGYKNIGFCLLKISAKGIEKIISGTALLRPEEIKELLSERKMYRQKRRRNRRIKSKSNKFRHPRWRNRLNRSNLNPTIRHLISSHLNVVKFITDLVSSDTTSINMEYAKFDMSRISGNKDIKSGNSKTYALVRDDYTCQYCGIKDVPFQVHHMKQRKDGGTDIPSNLITLCSKCHSDHHSGLINANKEITRHYRDTGVMNTAMPFIYKELSKKYPTYKFYGYETKEFRYQNNIDKTHSNDALCLSLMDLNNIEYNDFKIEIELKQFRRNNRARTNQLTDRKYYIDKTRVATNRTRRTGQEVISLIEFKKENSKAIVVAKPGGPIMKRDYSDVKHRPGDIVRNLETGTIHIVKGWASTQFKVMTADGIDIKSRYIQKIKQNSGLVIL
jgi:5-methylcytosine-specific restriction endonuclease McrA